MKVEKLRRNEIITISDSFRKLPYVIKSEAFKDYKSDKVELLVSHEDEVTKPLKPGKSYFKQDE